MNYLFAIGLVLFLLPGPVLAVQTFHVRDGQTVTAVISSRELTRISVAGSANLEKVWVAAGKLQIQPDQEQGDIFIKPYYGTPGNYLSFFVRDTDGATYTIIAETRDVPSETILLKPHAVLAKPSAAARRRPKPYSHVQQIKRLILAMAQEKDMKGFTRHSDNTPIPLWHETTITRVALYQGYTFHGHVYTITNATAQPLTLNEQEFLDFIPETRAVSLGHYTIPGGASTSLYLVRDAADEPIDMPDEAAEPTVGGSP